MSLEVVLSHRAKKNTRREEWVVTCVKTDKDGEEKPMSFSAHDLIWDLIAQSPLSKLQPNQPRVDIPEDAQGKLEFVFETSDSGVAAKLMYWIQEQVRTCLEVRDAQPANMHVGVDPADAYGVFRLTPMP